MSNQKPTPAVDPESVPYWQALTEERLIVKACAECGKSHFYPRELCPHCHSDQLSWTDVSGLGEIYSFTVCRRPAGPAFSDETPYVVAIVELDEGPRMMSRITGDPEAVRIGQRVKVRFERQSDELTLPFFELAP
ncbi:Zn-ribbon domain-containing OB-fold protein [Novosphingobium sp. 9U]|uniref:Zn-ribbon domain-containing OB-fold protein n=1 Tax=Novosphingobium sp. 9U TaxID=2653158 RepID=UPI0012F235AC|nr:Zn-ribbon domain-containing OB-fold protein [Novosphingobium sp. 9U]VWX49945.1 Nucleic-acid-binding protein containing a zn-ribbon [Novosphingobium sp. 9U]